MKHGNIAIFVPHRGCPCRCSFCDQQAISGAAALPTPQQVWEAATLAAQRHGGKRRLELSFFGGSFTAIDRKEVLPLLRMGQRAVEELGLSGMRCSTRPDAIDKETLSFLRDYGMTAVELGAQSMNDQVLAANRRGHSAKQVEQAAKLIGEAGLELGLQMMTGLFLDTPEGSIETAKRLIALSPDTVRIYPTLVLEHTLLAQLYREGTYRPQSLEEAVTLCATLLPLFESEGIRVIRLGLHSEESMERSKVAGPSHPALKELVLSRICLATLERRFSGMEPGDYEVLVAPGALSVTIGQKRENIRKLETLGFHVGIRPDPGVKPGDYVLRATH